MLSPIVRRPAVVVAVLTALSVSSLLARQPQPTLLAQPRGLPIQAGPKGAVDRADVGDFYYFAGAPVRLLRSSTEMIVRFSSAQAADDLLQGPMAAASAQRLSSGGREYRVVTMPMGQRPSSGRAWVDELRQQNGVDFAAPVMFYPGTGQRMLLSEEIVVKLGAGIDMRALENLATAQGVRVARAVPYTRDEFVLEVSSKGADPLSISRALYESGVLEWAEPNFIQDLRRHAVPNDPRFGQQWHLSNTGALGGTSGADVKAPSAWDIETGKPATVIAIVDDGVQTSHPDLAANIFQNPGEVPGNGIDDDANTFIDDVNGWDFGSNDNDPNPSLSTDAHGTAVAGVAAARGNNAAGVTGACQNCRILPVRIDLSTATVTVLGNAIRYAATLADVINNSWGGGPPSATIQSAIAFANTNGRGGKGSLVMFSTGNSASDLGLWSVNGIPAGTHRFRITYLKDSTVSSGSDTAWLAWSRFPGAPLDTFQSGSLPAGWSTGGNASWTVVTDPTHSDESMCLTRSARAGAVLDSQSTYIQAVRTVTSGTWSNYLWVSSEANFDGISVQIDINNNGTIDFDTGLWASGNAFVNQAVAYPAAHPEAIAVGASSDRDCRSDYSQFGPELAFLAPSSGGPLNALIETTDRTGAFGYDAGDYTQAAGVSGFSGTSSAAPLASGVAGLVVSRNPNLTRAEILQILQGSADKVGPEPYPGGRNNRYGFGRLNANAALLATPTGGPPVATNDSYNTSQNTQLVVPAPGVLGNDNANGGGVMTAVLDTTATSGTLSLNTNGGFTYTPVNGFSGPVTFSYHAVNNNGNSGVATVTITVSPNNPPVAANDAYNVAFNGFLNITAPGVLANDNANGGGAMTAQKLSDPASGTLSFQSTGAFTFTPATNFSGQVTYTYRASNSGGQSNPATVTITVGAGNPVANDDNYTTPFNTLLTVAAPGVLGNDNANGGANLQAVLNSNPIGTVTLNANGSFQYTPANGWTGLDAFTYKARTSVGDSFSAAVRITVGPQPPGAPGFSAHPQSRTVYVGQTARFSVGLTGNPFPTCVWQQSTDLGTTWTNTNLTLTTMAIPNATLAMSGTQYRCFASNTQGTAVSNAATLSVAAITPGALATGAWTGQTGQAQAMSFTLNAGAGQGFITPLSYAASDGCTSLSSTVNGQIGVANNRFTLDLNGIGACTTATRSITGTFGTTTGASGTIVHDYPFSQPPGCNCTGTFVTEWTTATGSALAPQIALHPESTNPPAGQKAQFTAAATGTPTPAFHWQVLTSGSASWIDVPAASPFSGSTTPTLTILSSGVAAYNGAQFRARAQNASGSVTSNLATLGGGPPGPPPPTAAGDDYNTAHNSALTAPAPGVLANDNSNGGGVMTAVLVSNPANGTVSLASSGGFTYTPNNGFSGNDVFTYRASTVSGGASAPATVTIAVASDGIPPAPSNFHVTGMTGNSVTLAWTLPTSGPTPTTLQLEGGLTQGSVLGAVPLGVTPSITIALPSGSFYLRMRTNANGVFSGPSNEILAHINVPVTPSKPANLLGLVNGGALALSWTPTFSGGAPSGTILDVSGAIAASLPLGNVETFQFPSVPPGTYTFNVRQTNAGGASTQSNPVTLTFAGVCSGAPQPPATFIAYKVAGILTLAWDPPLSGAAATAYLLNVTGSFVGTLPMAGRALSVPGPPGTFNLSVIAANACGASAPTPVQTVSFP